MNQNFEISCPCCGTTIDVNKLLKEKLLSELKVSLKSEENTFIRNQIAKAESDAHKKMEELMLENENNIKEINNELNQKSKEIKRLKDAEAEIIELRRKTRESEENAELNIQKRIHEALESESKRLVDRANQKSQFEIKALKKQLGDQINLTKEMQRKQEQGSVQLQGEAGELIIEEWLKDRFKLDDVKEIKKGENGADCLQTINTREKLNCGTIYYESKRTKTFQNSWIDKFKNDIREKGADVGVLVTKTMPSGSEKIRKINGVIVCGFNEFKVIAPVLRDSLLQLNSVQSTDVNKADKMALLYGFLTSNEFKLHVEGVVEGITQMQEEMIREKNMHKKLWKQREKQLERVVDNTIGIYGAIKGIAGKSIPEIETLKLKENE